MWLQQWPPSKVRQEIRTKRLHATCTWLQAVRVALGRVGEVDPWRFHHAVRGMYSWHSIAQRTERVYERALQVRLRFGGLLANTA